MNTLADLRPGDIGFGPLSDAAAIAMWGQFILGEGFSVGRTNVGHVFVVTAAGDSLGNGIELVEAMPHGAELNYAGVKRWTSRYAYVRLPEDYPGQGQDAAAIARAMVGTPYSFASYAALAAWRLGFKAKRLETWINRRKAMQEIPDLGLQGHGPTDTIQFGRRLPAEAICSVLADQAWALTGKQVMPAGTPHQCVTPGALADALLRMPGARWFWPGGS